MTALRLRAILMVLAAAGQPSTRAKKLVSAGARRLTSLQVLPLDDSERAWPRLMGRTLFAVFGGTRPAVRHLQLDAGHDRIPDDIMECWATCFWAAQAAMCALEAQKNLRAAARRFTALSRQIYLLTALWPEELECNSIKETIAKLSERFAGRLDLNAPQIAEAHRQTIKELEEAEGEAKTGATTRQRAVVRAG
jgi:hypothetical protein